MPSGLISRRPARGPGAERTAWLRGVTYAHRGLHGQGRVENSAGAFAAAIAAGLGVECDVQRTLDGRAVVFHDWDLDRLTEEQGPVAARTMAQLANVKLRGTIETIPTLPALLELVAGRAALLIELKSRKDRSVVPLCRAVLRDLEGYAGPHAVMSFDARVGRWFAAHSPETVRGLVVSEANARTFGAVLKRHLALWRSKPDFLAYDVRDLPSRFAAAQAARGLPVLTWTVSSRATAQTGMACAHGCIAEGEGLASLRASP